MHGRLTRTCTGKPWQIRLVEFGAISPLKKFGVVVGHHSVDMLFAASPNSPATKDLKAEKVEVITFHEDWGEVSVSLDMDQRCSENEIWLLYVAPCFVESSNASAAFECTSPPRRFVTKNFDAAR